MFCSRYPAPSSAPAAGPGDHILSYLGTIAGHDIQFALGFSTAQTVYVARFEKGDCLVTVNVWWLTRTLRGLTRLARQRGATVSVLTDLHASPLAEYADHLIVTPIEGIHAGPPLTAMVAAVFKPFLAKSPTNTRFAPRGRSNRCGRSSTRWTANPERACWRVR